MSDREKIYQLLDVVPDCKIGYVIAYLQDLTGGEDAKPNAETLAAMKKLEDGGGECFDTLDELWSRACLKIHSHNLHSPLCAIFNSNLVNVARYTS